jgi:uncharacterized protein (TIGR03437 family)
MRLFCTLLLAASAIAQPKITAVVNAADFTSNVAYGGLGTIFGMALSDANYSAPGLPLPQKLGPTELFVCVGGAGYANRTEITDGGCEALQLIYASPTQINFLMFDSLPQKPGFAGQLFAFVRVNGVLSNGDTSTPQMPGFMSPASRLFLVNSAPAIFLEGTDSYVDARFITPTVFQTTRRAVTDQQGNVLTSANPARVGQYYTIWFTGLGAFANGKPVAPIAMSFGSVPVFGYPAPIALPASTSYVGPSPQFPGLYQINFQLPSFVVDGKALGYGDNYSPGSHFFPCGNYDWEIGLNIDPQAHYQWWTLGGATLIPVAVKNGDIPCGS